MKHHGLVGVSEYILEWAKYQHKGQTVLAYLKEKQKM